MSDKEAILITGVSSYWGARVAERLLAEHDLIGDSQDHKSGERRLGTQHVIGVDALPLDDPIQGLDFIQTDVRNSLFVELLKSENIQTIVHLAFQENYRSSESAFDLNVIGTMKVLGAAAEAGVRKVILKSSTQVYGAVATNSAFLTERQSLINGSKTDGTTRNLVEIEAFCNGFRRQVPGMVLTILRFPGVIGPKVDSPMTRFLKLNPPPILLGFDPQMQIIHEEDVIGAIVHAVDHDISGIYNIAAEGVFPLAKILGMVGKIPLPVVHLFAYWGTSLMQASGVDSHKYYPISLDYLRYPWVADTSQMRDEMGFSPLYTAEEALREFSSQMRLTKYKPQTPDLSLDEALLRDTLERRKRVRDRLSNTPDMEEGAENV